MRDSIQCLLAFFVEGCFVGRRGLACQCGVAGIELLLRREGQAGLPRVQLMAANIVDQALQEGAGHGVLPGPRTECGFVEPPPKCKPLRTVWSNGLQNGQGCREVAPALGTSFGVGVGQRVGFFRLRGSTGSRSVGGECRAHGGVNPVYRQSIGEGRIVSEAQRKERRHAAHEHGKVSGESLCQWGVRGAKAVERADGKALQVEPDVKRAVLKGALPFLQEGLVLALLQQPPQVGAALLQRRLQPGHVVFVGRRVGQDVPAQATKQPIGHEVGCIGLP